MSSHGDFHLFYQFSLVLVDCSFHLNYLVLIILLGHYLMLDQLKIEMRPERRVQKYHVRIRAGCMKKKEKR